MTALPIAPAQAAIIDRAAARALANVGAHGLAITLARDGTIVYAKGFGKRDLASGAPADPGTIFALGPITKQFTAAAIEVLRASGKLSLDARVSEYLPAAPHGSELRVSDLLHETSGLPDYLDGDIAAIVGSTAVTPAHLLASVANEPLRFPPGTRYEASNTNYVALGAIVEAVSGQPYAQFVRRAIAAPLGLSTLTFGPPAPPAEIAIGYGIADPDTPVAAWTAQSTYAAGGLYASEADLARWDDAFFGGKLLSKAIVDEMTTPPVLSDGTRSSFAAGWFVDTIDGRRGIYERGGLPGESGLNCWLPELDASVTIFANTLGFESSALLHAAIRALDPAPLPLASEEPADTERARAEYAAWEAGTIDLHHYSPDMQALIASPAALVLNKELAAAGEPTSFAFEGRETAPGGVAHRYRIETPSAVYSMSLTYAPDGTIVRINFARLVRDGS